MFEYKFISKFHKFHGLKKFATNNLITYLAI